jgi:NitT/TauT family transport system substrate-binding protein
LSAQRNRVKLLPTEFSAGNIAMRRERSLLCGLAFAACFLLPSLAGAEEIKIGVLKSTSSGPVYLAIEKGYFKAEGLEPNLITFESAQPIAVAATGGDIDAGMCAFTGGLFALAGQGGLRVIAGYANNAPSFRSDALIVSNHAWDSGVRSYKDFANHVYGVSQIGAPPHYELALLAEKYHFDFKSVRIVALNSLANVASALAGGQVDASSLLGSAAIPMIDRGDVKFLGWTGDEVPFELGAAFTGTKTAMEYPDRIEKFLRVYRRGVREYHDAVTGPDGKRADGPGADAVAAIISKYTGLSPEQVKTGAVYFDPDAKISEANVMHEIEWFLKEGLIKAPVDPKQFFDARFVVEKPKN